MNRFLQRAFSIIALFILFQAFIVAQSIEQRLVLVQNDGVADGSFKIALQVKGTGLPAANTLGSATIDVQYDNTKLAYVSSSNWAFGSAEGYNRFAANNIAGFVRVGVTEAGVNSNGDGTPTGFDIASTYSTWVQLNFSITNSATVTSIGIIDGSNAIGLLENHANNPHTGVIINQPLSPTQALINQPLPVELTSFSAKADQNTVLLQWRTATEVKNLGFEVQRSILKKGVKEQWEKLGFVEGHVSSNSPKDYSFTDQSALYGTYLYRLKQINVDGTFEFSKEINTAVGQKPSKFELKGNFPNPFNPETKIRFAVPKASKVDLSVYNLIGEKIAVLENGYLEEGIYQRSFNGVNFASGIYLYVLEAEGVKLIQKMLLIK